MTRTLAYELARDGVTANTLLPGPVEGPRIEEMVASRPNWPISAPRSSPWRTR